MAAFLFLLAFSVYLLTLAPTISLPDSPELVATAFTLGVAHPPGHAVYLVLGKLFSFLPLGNIAWRLNVESAIFASLMVLVIFRVVWCIVDLMERVPDGGTGRARPRDWKRGGIAAFCAALLAFSPTFWGFVFSAEVYHVNLFLLSLLILAFVGCIDPGTGCYETRPLCLIAFVGGLLLAFHTANLFYVGAVFILLWARVWSNPQGKRKMGALLPFFLFLTLGLSVLVYLPIRVAASSSAIGFGEMVSGGGFWEMVTGGVYFDETPSFVSSWREGLWNVGAAFSSISDEFGLPLSLVGLLGLVFLGRGVPALFLLLFLVAVANVSLFGSARLGAMEGYRFPTHLFLPTYLVGAVLIGVGLAGMSRRWEAHGRTLPGLLVGPLMVAVPLGFLWANYQASDSSRAYRFYERGKRALGFMEEDALLLCTNRGNVLFNLWYFSAVEGRWQDVTPLSIQPFLVRPLEEGWKGGLPETLKGNQRNPSALVNELVALEIDSMPIYSNLAQGILPGSYVRIPRGTLYRIQRTADPRAVWVEDPQIGTPVRVNYRDAIEFLGLTFDPPRLRVGDTLRITYFWRALRETKMNYQVAVLVTGSHGEVIAGPFSELLSHSMAYGAFTAYDWPEGRVIRETYEFILQRRLEAGQYDLNLGLGKGPRLLPMMASGVPVNGRFARIVQFTVLP